MSIQKKSLKSSGTKPGQRIPAAAKKAQRKSPVASKSISLKQVALEPPDPC
jgi:hypothetical protein